MVKIKPGDLVKFVGVYPNAPKEYVWLQRVTPNLNAIANSLDYDVREKKYCKTSPPMLYLGPKFIMNWGTRQMAELFLHEGKIFCWASPGECTRFDEIGYSFTDVVYMNEIFERVTQ